MRCGSKRVGDRRRRLDAIPYLEGGSSHLGDKTHVQQSGAGVYTQSAQRSGRINTSTAMTDFDDLKVIGAGVAYLALFDFVHSKLRVTARTSGRRSSHA